MLKKIIIVSLSLALLTCFLLVINEGVERAEKAGCMKWQAQAKQYPSHYYTEAEKEQCLKVAPETLK